MKNDYYDIAINDLGFLKFSLASEFYNQIAINCQQVAEEMLKSVLDEVATGCESLLHSHNLRGIYDKIHAIDNSFSLSRGDLSMLKDIYFDAKYPGDNFVTVTHEECKEYVDILNTVIEATNDFRKRNGLAVVECGQLTLGVRECNFF